MRWCVWLVTTGVAASACSQGGITGKGSPQAILDARLDQGNGNACDLAGASRIVGAFGDSPVAIADGTQSTVVTCTVHDNGNSTFDLRGEISMNGERWLAVEGTLPAAYDKAANVDGIPVAGLRVSLSGTDATGAAVPFSESDGGCLLKYVGNAQGVTGGRAWAYLFCPRAARGELDAGDAAKTCTANIQVRFENCAF